MSRLVFAQKDVLAMGEGFRIQLRIQLLGVVILVYSHAAEIGAGGLPNLALHLGRHSPLRPCPAGAASADRHPPRRPLAQWAFGLCGDTVSDELVGYCAPSIGQLPDFRSGSGVAEYRRA